MSGPVAREIALIVNPSPAAGAPPALPAVEARLLALGLVVEVDATRDMGHACELAVGAAQRGRIVVTLSGTGCSAPSPGAARLPGAVVGILPGGRGNDFAQVAGIPLDAEAACDVIAGGTARAIDLGHGGRHPHRDRVAGVRLGGQSDRQPGAVAARSARVPLWRPARGRDLESGGLHRGGRR
jgi:diacylglycerol kinase family enzyme